MTATGAQSDGTRTADRRTFCQVLQPKPYVVLRSATRLASRIAHRIAHRIQFSEIMHTFMAFFPAATLPGRPTRARAGSLARVPATRNLVVTMIDQGRPLALSRLSARADGARFLLPVPVSGSPVSPINYAAAAERRVRRAWGM